jgi:hypothetical protein
VIRIAEVDDFFAAYQQGRADAGAGTRDAGQAEDPATGADYRRGFLDGRIEIFAVLAKARRFLDDSP